MAAREWDCRELSCGVPDYAQDTPLDEVLFGLERPTARVAAALSLGGEAEVFDLDLVGARVTLLATDSSRAERAPNPREANILLDLIEEVLERFRPQLLLTYGGYPICLEMMRRARARGIAAVFHLHNFSYNDRRAFSDVKAIILPSDYSRRFHAGRLGLQGQVIPDPIRLERKVGGPGPEVRDVHQPPARQRGDGVRADRYRAGREST
jgi:hypothetical protein